MIIPYGKHTIDKYDLKEVSKSLKSIKISGGDYIKKLEDYSSKYFNVKYSVSCNSGTSSLFLAMLAIRLEPNDNVILPSINFIASANICKIFKANIYLCDVDPLTGQMRPEDVEKCIIKYKLKKIKALFTMYLGGFANNIIEFFNLKKKYNFFLIEDACHALGSYYEYKNLRFKIGSCEHSDICCFSLHPLKTITSGEGGLVTTKNKNFYKRMNLYRSHGMKQNPKRHWKYNFISPGLNLRMSDINAALAFSQFKKINKFISKRKIISKRYNKILKNLPNLYLTEERKIKNSSNHLFIIHIAFNKIKKKKDIFFEFLKKNNVLAQFHYTPLYEIDYLKKSIKNKFDKMTGSKLYKKNSISIPIYYDLNLKNQMRVINLIKNFIYD